MSPDPSKSPSENVVESLRQLVTRSGITKTKKLAYLNALVHMWGNVIEAETRKARGGTTEEDAEGAIRLREVMLW